MALAEVCGLRNYLIECQTSNEENNGLPVGCGARNLVNNMELALPPFRKVSCVECLLEKCRRYS